MSHTLRMRSDLGDTPARSFGFPHFPGGGRLPLGADRKTPRRPRPGDSQSHPGVHPLNPVQHRNVSFQQLPPPLGNAPYRYNLEEHHPEVAEAIKKAGKMRLHVAGDTGGVKDAHYQTMVAEAMIRDIEKEDGSAPHFLYHVGDVVYFNGTHDVEYYAQFYEPYFHYTPPIFSIPGNHDGEVDDASHHSLEGWIAYFMQSVPDVDPLARDAPKIGLSLPNVYWTLETPLATFVGLYTNVPEHGSIHSEQQQWFTNELAEAPEDKALIVSLHHPIYSYDDHHSGSAKMADVLENAIRDTGRVPNMVLSGHVHNYQRIEKSIHPDHVTPFLVVGNGGYHNLHGIHSPNGTQGSTGDILRYGVEKRWGYATMEIDGANITGGTTEIDKDGNITPGDTWPAYTTAALKLANPRSVTQL